MIICDLNLLDQFFLKTGSFILVDDGRFPQKQYLFTCRRYYFPFWAGRMVLSRVLSLNSISVTRIVGIVHWTPAWRHRLFVVPAFVRPCIEQKTGTEVFSLLFVSGIWLFSLLEFLSCACMMVGCLERTY